MTDDQEPKRKYSRLKTNWIGKIRQKSGALNEETMISNISTGGVFIDTTMPFPIGTHIEIEFKIPGQPQAVQAEGIVKWSNNGSQKDMPIGMGIQFIEVHTKSKTAILSFIDESTLTRFTDVLTQTEAHKELLTYYCRKVGETFDASKLINYLKCSSNAFHTIIEDFTRLHLTEVTDDRIKFLELKNNELAAHLKKWFKDNA